MMLFTNVLPGSFLFGRMEFDSISVPFVILYRKLIVRLCSIRTKGLKK